jgi:hypothetical protein
LFATGSAASSYSTAAIGTKNSGQLAVREAAVLSDLQMQSFGPDFNASCFKRLAGAQFCVSRFLPLAVRYALFVRAGGVTVVLRPIPPPREDPMCIGAPIRFTANRR